MSDSTKIAALEKKMAKVEIRLDNLDKRDRVLEVLLSSVEQILKTLGSAPDDASGEPGVGLMGQVAWLVRRTNANQQTWLMMAKSGTVFVAAVAAGAGAVEIVRFFL